jgi:hypothetical protein
MHNLDYTSETSRLLSIAHTVGVPIVTYLCSEGPTQFAEITEAKIKSEYVREIVDRKIIRFLPLQYYFPLPKLVYNVAYNRK